MEKKYNFKQQIKIRTLVNQYPEWSKQYIEYLLNEYKFESGQLSGEISEQKHVFDQGFKQFQENNQNLDIQQLLEDMAPEPDNKPAEKILNFEKINNFVTMQEYDVTTQYLNEYIEHLSINNPNFNIENNDDYKESEIWPKYIGSLQTVLNSEDQSLGLDCSHNEEVFVEFPQIGYEVTETKQSSIIRYKANLQLDSFNAYVKTKQGDIIGKFIHKYFFIWNFLVTQKIIDIRLYFIETDQYKEGNNIRIDVYLLSNSIKQLSIFEQNQQKTKNSNLTEEGVQQQKTSEYVFECFNLLIILLKIKINIKALLTPQPQKIFQRINTLSKYISGVKWYQKMDNPLKNKLPTIYKVNEKFQVYYENNQQLDNQQYQQMLDEQIEDLTDLQTPDLSPRNKQANQNLQKNQQQEMEIEEIKQPKHKISSNNILQSYDNFSDQMSNDNSPFLSEDDQQNPNQENSLDFNEQNKQIKKTLKSQLMEDLEDDENSEEVEEVQEEENLIQSQQEGMQEQIEDIETEKLLGVTSSAAQYFKHTLQPENLKTQLMDYQKQALIWMSFREGRTSLQDAIIDPKYSDQQQRKLGIFWQELILLDGTKLYHNQYSGQITYEFIKNSEKSCKGGILADEMGLGKTLMAIGLIVGFPPENDHKKRKIYIDAEIQEQKKQKKVESVSEHTSISQANIENNLEKYQFYIKNQKQQKRIGLVQAGTLIVVPKSLINQWVSEIEKHTQIGCISYLEYYDQKTRERQNSLNIFDIVITTYNILQIEYQNYSKRQKKQNLFKYKWQRIILDEGHIIKSKMSQCAQGAYNLEADNRWVLTGTPLQNKLDDLFSLVHFLKLDIFQNYQWWNKYINKNENKQEVMHMISNILHPILLRRTKYSKYEGGKEILSLPEKVTEIVKVQFEQHEGYLYRCFNQRQKIYFQDLIKTSNFKSNLIHVFAMLQRLRQLCNHSFLVFKKKNQKLQDSLIDTEQEGMKIIKNAVEEFLTESLEKNAILPNFKKDQQLAMLDDSNDCLICLDSISLQQDISLLQCGHFYHSTCVSTLKIQNAIQCPMCRTDKTFKELKFDQKKKILDKSNKKILNKQKQIDKIYDDYQQPSSKIKAILQEVIRIKQLKEKCIVYSQWIPFLNMLQTEFSNNQIQTQRIDGSMTSKERQQQIHDFNTKQNSTVFLISLKAGALGLNLVSANHVLISDPWWNPSVEDQASDRCHRIGQTKKVYIKNFICENSIEERIIKLQLKKRKLIAKTFNNQINTQNLNNDNEEDIKYLLDYDNQE